MSIPTPLGQISKYTLFVENKIPGLQPRNIAALLVCKT